MSDTCALSRSFKPRSTIESIRFPPWVAFWHVMSMGSSCNEIPSPQEVHLTTRSKEEALLADERTSLCVIAVAVCVGLSQVSNSMFCDGRSTCSVL